MSFTQAARELGLTQAGISKQIKLLEQWLREPLFTRKTRSLELTKAGAAYLPKVREGFERLASGTTEVFGRTRPGILTVRSAVSFAVNWLAPRIHLFAQAHGDVELKLISSVWNDPFNEEPVNLDIQYGNGQWQGFSPQQLTSEYLAPVCSPHVAATLKGPADLANHRLIHVLGYENGWVDWFSAAGLGEARVGMDLRFDTSITAIEVAVNGGGVLLGRSSIVEKELQSGRLVKPFDLTIPSAEAFYLLSPTNAAPHPHAHLFRDWIVGLCEEARCSLPN